MKIFLYLFVVIFSFISCSKGDEEWGDNLLGSAELKITRAFIEISADPCTIKYEIEGEHLPPLSMVRETEYTTDWMKKNFYDCGGKLWSKVEYSDEKGNYPGICSNPNNPEEMIVTDGEYLGKTVSIQIPKNTTSKKRCFYLYFDHLNLIYAMTCILQHEK